jgi:hypothetical protein
MLTSFFIHYARQKFAARARQCWHYERDEPMQEDQVPTEQIGQYEIEYSGVKMVDVGGWAAYVTIYGPSSNPMHRNDIVPNQRVAVEQVFASEREAEAQARDAALAMLQQGSHRQQ